MSTKERAPRIPLKICHSVEGASEATDIAERKIWQAIEDGDLRSFKLGRTRLIYDPDLREWIEGLREAAL